MQQTSSQPSTPPLPAKPNENGSVSVQAKIKIFDPVTKTVFVEKRA